MTIVVIGGTPHAPLEAFEQHFQQLGLASALPSQASEIGTVHEWIDRYFASGVPAEITDPTPPPVAKASLLSRWLGTATTEAPVRKSLGISTPWLLSLSNLILANAGQPAWGWANRRNSHLIDLWLDVDPATRFVGLITPPEHALAHAQQASDAPIDAAAVLAVWRQTTERLLTVQRQQPQRVRLLDARTANGADGMAVANWLGLPEATDSQAEPADSAVLPAPPLKAPDPLLVSTFARVARDDAATAAVWRSVQTQLKLPQHAAADEAAQVAQAVIQLRADLQTARDAQAQSQQTAAAEKAAANRQHEAVEKELRSESELLLTQLHQVQEELERLFLKEQQTAQERDTEAKAKQAATLERDAKAKLVKDRDSSIGTLQKEAAELKAARDAEAKAKQAATAERDAQAKLVKDRDSSIGILQKEAADLKTARDALQQRLKEHEAQQAELQEESELLLAQLHQVQEELERYFLDGQALKQEKAQLEQRVARLLKRLPGTLEWDDLAVEASKTSLTLTLQQVATAERQLPQLKLALARQKKQPTLQVIDAEGQEPTLRHGPLALPLNPAAAAGTPQAEVLEQLAPSDLSLLQHVCSSVATALPSGVTDQAKWAADLTLLAEQLAALPPVWRYDAVSLRHEQVNPDYEHLWFHFDNAAFGARRWPSFEFRLSAANVRKGKFSQYPKLEFPEPDSGLPKQFENWFEESEDDHGVKYELRFDLRKTAMDVDAWSALNDEDQAQMLSIIRSLPRVMRQIEEQGVAIKRPWSDWRNLLAGLKSVMAQCLLLDVQIIEALNS